jgi:hypothetical protein
MSGVEIKNTLKALDKVLKGKYAISTEKMQDVYNVLSRYFDISAPTSFKSQIEQAIKPGDTLFGKAAEKATELVGQTPEVRQKAIENLLKKILGDQDDIIKLPKIDGGGKIDSVNPTRGVFTEYSANERATAKLGENITTLDKTMGKSPDEMITIYRGAPKNQTKINAGDFVTTNEQLAKDYAGNGKVLKEKVKLSDLLDDLTEPLGEEYIYRPKPE